MSKRGADDLLVSPGTVDSMAKKMDTKSSPIKDIDKESNQEEDIVTKIKETVPEWFSEAFSYIIRTIKEESSTAITAQNQLQSKIESLECRISDLESHKAEQDLVISKLKNEVDNLEAYSRRDNLVVEGIQESPDENLRDKVTDFLKTKLNQQDASNIQLSRVHRLGKPLHQSSHVSMRPRPVIIHFQNYADRERIWKASWDLNEKHLFIREDFTEATRQRRSQLLPVLKAAKRDPHIGKCTLRGDKLIIDGTLYRVEDFGKLPERLKWFKKGERYFQKCDSTFFFGKQCFLSNHHSSPIHDQGTNYNCVEQLYLRQKSLHFDDTETARKIMKESNPGIMKRLAHSIKGLDEKKWLHGQSKISDGKGMLSEIQPKQTPEREACSQPRIACGGKQKGQIFLMWTFLSGPQYTR